MKNEMTPGFKPFTVLSLCYITRITNVWGCMEILSKHCGAGSVKVNYYRCKRKILGLVKPKPHKVNKIQMRLSYVVFISTPFATGKNTNNLTQIELLQAKIVFGIHTQ